MDDGRPPRLNRTFKRRRPFLCLLSFGRSKRKYEKTAKESKNTAINGHYANNNKIYDKISAGSEGFN